MIAFERDSKGLVVTQPYVLTGGSYNWTPLMCNIVGVIIYHISVKDDKKDCKIFGRSTVDEYGHHVLEIPLKTLHGEIEGIDRKSRDYDAVVKAVIRLWNSPIKIRAKDGKWDYMQIITKVESKIDKGNIRIKVDPESWAFLSKIDTYTKFNILRWISLSSFYSKRLALLAQGWTEKPIYYKAETLLELFDLPSTYLIRKIATKILEPSMKELTIKNDISFNFKKVYEPCPKNGRPKLIGYLLWKIQNEEPENNWVFSEYKMIQRMNKEGIHSILEKETFNTLMKLGLRPEEIKSNIYILYHISLRYNIKNLIEKFEEELQDLEDEKNLTFQNHKGYYIKRMKKILDQENGD